MGDQHDDDNTARVVYVTCGNETTVFEVDSNFENGLGASGNNEETMHLHLKDKCAIHKDRCYLNQKPKQPTDSKTGFGAGKPDIDWQCIPWWVDHPSKSPRGRYTKDNNVYKGDCDNRHLPEYASAPYNDKKHKNRRNKYPYDCTMAPNNEKKDRNCHGKSTKPTDKPPCRRYDECSKHDYSETASTTSTASTMKSSVKMGRNKCEPCPHVKPCRSRELRGGVLYTDCHCLRRNGLQYDCRRSGCQRSPECEVLPAPTCEPSRQACIRHRTNPHAEPLTIICDQQPQ